MSGGSARAAELEASSRDGLSTVGPTAAMAVMDQLEAMSWHGASDRELACAVLRLRREAVAAVERGVAHAWTSFSASRSWPTTSRRRHLAAVPPPPRDSAGVAR